MSNVLLVGNQMDIIRALSADLSRLGFSCAACIYTEDVIEQDLKQVFNVVLIDISAASSLKDSAWNWFRKLKLRRLLPIIALVSASTLHLLEEQAFDDFIVRPWNVNELSARIYRIRSRINKVDKDRVIKAGDLTIDPVSCEAELSGRLLALTFKEYELLKLLATNKGKVYTREALLNEVWGYDYYGGDRTVDVHIRRLRSKIEDSGHTFIETVRNIGYKFKESRTNN